MTKQPKVLDLFSGCGGMSWGLEKSGFTTVAAVDSWEIALETFKVNHPAALIYKGDIRELDAREVLRDLELGVGELDVIVGGPPCQGFSKNVPAAYRYLDDPRNQLFREYMRFVEVMQPKVVVMENVAEIFNAYQGGVRHEILSWLARLGYSVDVKVLVASDFGVPQRRRRCVFLAYRSSTSPLIPKRSADVAADVEQTFLPSKHVSAWDAISDLPPTDEESADSGRFYDRDSQNDFQAWCRQKGLQIFNHRARKLAPLQQQRYEALLPGQGIKDLPDAIRPKGGYSGAYGRLDFTSLAPTITRWVFHPGSGRYGHPVQYRSITMREAARIQSFTDDFVFCGTYNDIAGQIGNAVPPLLMHALAPEIARGVRLIAEGEENQTELTSSALW